MIHKPMELWETWKFYGDIARCYKDNPQVGDYQCSVDFSNPEEVVDFINSYINDRESMVEGIYSDDKEELLGLIIYDNIRLTDDGNAAQVHICLRKTIWGKATLPVIQEIANHPMFNVLYATIPSCCHGAISLCKKLGFKKTGYVPKALPYRNIKGEVKMMDNLIFSYEIPKKENHN